MKKRIGLDQTTAWVIAILGAAGLFSLIYVVSNKIALKYQAEMRAASGLGEIHGDEGHGEPKHGEAPAHSEAPSHGEEPKHGEVIEDSNHAPAEEHHEAPEEEHKPEPKHH